MSEGKRKAVIIGAGPAGLTAALELLRRTDIIPVIYESSSEIGGISRTINYKGNRMDIGGHRFFSKSDRVMQWWMDILPVESDSAQTLSITYHGKEKTLNIPELHGNDEVMLIRNRKSRIYYLKRFFSYPVKLSLETLKGLGLMRTMRIMGSYILARTFPVKEEKSLEDYIVNRFGRELYNTFFRDYTHKVWGIPCSEIPAEWGAQRIKGVSISKTLMHAAKQLFAANERHISQKSTETSLIEKFLYPKLGPGQLWEKVARMIREAGGEIHLDSDVVGIRIVNNKVHSIQVKTAETEFDAEADFVFSTMPVKTLIDGISPRPPEEVCKVAAGLQYRDFITVGLLLNKLEIEARSGKKLSDNWIYIQENTVMLGRLQIFNNWSPFLVSDPEKVWLGLEYFCNETDEFWQKNDSDILQFAIQELSGTGIIKADDVADGTVVRVPKTYPAYFGTYNEFNKVRDYVDSIENLFLIGRNGMHKYNNQDHSMLTAMTAVDNIISARTDKNNIWEINTEMEYHEEK